MLIVESLFFIKVKIIGAYVAGYVEEKYIILGLYDDKGCILSLIQM